MKEATTTTDILKEIRERWSPRAFTDKEISAEDFSSLFEAASWAPSAMNEQPWRFVAARKEDTSAFETLQDLLVPGNEVWAKEAGALIVVVSKDKYAYKNKENINYQHDAGLATMNLLIQATYKGLHAHVMEGFDKEKAWEVLALSEDIHPLTMIAVGYRGEPSMLEDKLKERELSERKRRSLDETVFSPGDSIK